MRINFRIIWLAQPLVFGACSDSSDADTRPATETISVSVGSGPKIDIESEDKSRTQLGEDGVSVKWASDDQIALWAVNSRSETVFSKQAFKLYHYNTDYNTAKFRGDIPQMPADTYTYYAVSPVPSESDGTQATYLIPDVQDGGFNGDWDVMVADPVKAPALEKNDTGETVQFQFRHKVHVLKIRIPKNDLGEKVSEITLAFPQPVTGRMTVDAADPDAAPTLTDGNNTLTLRFDTPKGADDVVFAVIAPVELTAEQPVTITAICEAGESEPRNIPGKHFSEGHTTPIAYHIPAIGRYYTRLNFSLPADKGTATLGAVNKGTVTEEHEYIQDGQDRSRIFAVIVDWNSRHATVAGMGSPTGVWDPAKTAETAEGPVIAYGSLLIGETTPGDAMTTVEIPIEYYDRTTKPTGAYTLIISCTTSAYGDFKVGCLGNVMYVDDFEWVY